jgi:Eukaryotic translation initiation factor 3 subunit 8 N-terminus
MSSRFFHGGDSDSESSSSEEEELYGDAGKAEESEEESSEEESESEDEDKVTVVKSAKDKRLEELEGTVRLIENAEKINDWAVISTGMLINLGRTITLIAFVTRIRQDEPSSRQDYPIRLNAKTVHKNHCRLGRHHQ